MFYEQLKKLCNFKGIKLTPLVKEMGLTTGNIGRWKQGGQPSVEVLQRFADYFGVTTDFLLGIEPEPPNVDTSGTYLLGSDGTYKHINIPEEKIQGFLDKYPVYSQTPSEQEKELLELWKQLDSIEQADFKGQLKGYLKAKSKHNVSTKK